jgi:hypothetical protein
MLIFSFINALMSVDLPVFGRPMTATNPALKTASATGKVFQDTGRRGLFRTSPARTGACPLKL